MRIPGKIKLLLLKMAWKRRNKHNNTNIENIFDINCVSVGNATYGNIFVLAHGDDYKVKIGNYCSIGPQVAFILQSNHDYKCFTTFPFKSIYGLAANEAKGKGDICVEDDVWIGMRTIVLSGITIGQGAVIGAGTILTKDVPPYAIVAGNPGKVIGYRFEDSIIDKLKELKLSKLSKNDIVENIDTLYMHINKADDVDILKMKLFNNENYK